LEAYFTRESCLKCVSRLRLLFPRKIPAIDAEFRFAIVPSDSLAIALGLFLDFLLNPFTRAIAFAIGPNQQ
jgi:hypothetical protein